VTTQASESSAGFVYVATGEKYMNEAVRSVRSLREHNPGIRVCLLADRDPPSGLFDDIISIPKPAFGFADKLHMVRAPYQRAVFLDTDTLIVGDISGLFRLLEFHDIAAKLEVYPGWDYDFPELPKEFIEYNTGVIAFRKTPHVEQFFTDWTTEYHSLAASSRRFNTDQPSFRRTLYRSPLRHCAIPTEYHLQADMGGYLYWDARLIHCHHDQERAARIANRVRGARAYLPKLATIPTSYSGLRGHLGTWLRLNWDFFVAFWMSLAGKIRRNPRKFG
jgi:hypothetical protein